MDPENEKDASGKRADETGHFWDIKFGKSTSTDINSWSDLEGAEALTILSWPA